MADQCGLGRTRADGLFFLEARIAYRNATQHVIILSGLLSNPLNLFRTVVKVLRTGQGQAQRVARFFPPAFNHLFALLLTRIQVYVRRSANPFRERRGFIEGSRRLALGLWRVHDLPAGGLSRPNGRSSACGKQDQQERGCVAGLHGSLGHPPTGRFLEISFRIASFQLPFSTGVEKTARGNKC
jgi:hypothetical protein